MKTPNESGEQTPTIAARLWTFGRRVARNFVKNKGLLLAGAVGYNALLSVIPLFAVLLVVFSHFLDKQLLLEIMSAELALVLPGQSEAVTEALASFVEERDLIGGIGFLVLLFFSSIAFRMLEDAMAVIFRHHEWEKQRHPIISALIPFAYITCIGIALFLVTLTTAVLEAGSGKGITILAWEIPIEFWTETLLQLVGFVGMVLILSSFYRVMPLAQVRLRLALVGGTVAAILWEVVRRVLVWYFASISLVNVIYGSLATVIIVLLSMEIAAVIILLGAQIIAELEKSSEAGRPWWEDPKS